MLASFALTAFALAPSPQPAVLQAVPSPAAAVCEDSCVAAFEKIQPAAMVDKSTELCASEKCSGCEYCTKDAWAERAKEAKETAKEVKNEATAAQKEANVAKTNVTKLEKVAEKMQTEADKALEKADESAQFADDAAAAVVAAREAEKAAKDAEKLAKQGLSAAPTPAAAVAPSPAAKSQVALAVGDAADGSVDDDHIMIDGQLSMTKNTDSSMDQPKCKNGCPAPPYLDWIPKHKVGVCACPKCGTTAIYQGIYRGLLKKEPFEKHNWGFIQQIYKKEWQNTFAKEAPKNFFVSKPSDSNPSGKGEHDGYSIAFVREPVSRLISAWKDKMSCGLFIPTGNGEAYFEAADERSRREHIAWLLEVEGRGRKASTVTSTKCPDPHYDSPHTTPASPRSARTTTASRSVTSRRRCSASTPRASKSSSTHTSSRRTASASARAPRRTSGTG